MVAIPPGFEVEHGGNPDRALPAPALSADSGTIPEWLLGGRPAPAAARPAGPPPLPPGFELEKPAKAEEPGLISTIGRSIAEGVPILGAAPRHLNAITQAIAAPVLPGDETISHAPTFAERRAENLKRENQRSEAGHAAHPIISTAAELAGGFAGPGAALKVAPAVAGPLLGLGGKTLANQVVRGAVSGAGINAADAGLRGSDPETAALMGAGVGGAFPVVARGAGAIARGIAGRRGAEAPAGAQAAAEEAIRAEGPGNTAGVAPTDAAMGVPEFPPPPPPPGAAPAAAAPGSARISEAQFAEIQANIAKRKAAEEAAASQLPIGAPGEAAPVPPESPIPPYVAPVEFPEFKPVGGAAPLTMGQYIRRNGGLELTPDMRSSDFHNALVPGKVGPVAHEEGLSLDGFWRKRLMEEGYLPRDADGHFSRDIRDEVTHALQEEAAGRPTYREADRHRVNAKPQLDDYSKAIEGHAEEIVKAAERDAGLRRNDIETADLYSAAEMMHRGEETDPVAALERAMTERVAPHEAIDTLPQAGAGRAAEGGQGNAPGPKEVAPQPQPDGGFAGENPFAPGGPGHVAPAPVRVAPATLAAQQKQLLAGERPAQMFPGGKDEPPVPEGMRRYTAPIGDVFHYNPQKVTESQVAVLSGTGRENELLGLGPTTKTEAVARETSGEAPAAVVERNPAGTEVRAAAGTESTVPAQVAAMEAGKSPGHTVGVEHPADLTAERTAARDNAPLFEGRNLTLGALKQASQNNFRAIDNTGVRVSPDAVERVVRAVAKELYDTNRRPEFQKQVYGLLENMASRMHDMTFGDLVATVQRINDLRSGVPNADAPAAALGVLKRHIVEFMNNPKTGDMVGGNPQQNVRLLQEANKGWAAFRSVEKLETTLANAKFNAASTGAGNSNLTNNVIQAFKPIAKAIAAGKMQFPPDVVKAINDVAMGKNMKLIRHASKFAPTGIVSLAADAVLGHGIGVPMAAMMAGGAVAKRAAERKIIAKAQAAIDAMKSHAPAQRRFGELLPRGAVRIPVGSRVAPRLPLLDSSDNR